jgi:acetyl-CoA decarbonylase/synthase complex subunit gamma
LSFDALRKELKGLDAWIIVLDTKGVNVWCAAGKGTFGTNEIVNRIGLVGLEKIVNHRKIILPQLGAPGVAAHEVKKLCGFSAIYGPVRACDLIDFIKSGMKATPRMRQVEFSLYDRLVLTPVEFVTSGRNIIFMMAVLFFLSGMSAEGYSSNLAMSHGLRSILNLFAAYLSGTVIAPLLLPWLPGRSFSFKGFSVGLVVAVVLFLLKLTGSRLETVAWIFLIPVVSSFLAMNFTGASTYTSLSGVKKEMRVAVPLQIIALVLGIGVWITGRFV